MEMPLLTPLMTKIGRVMRNRLAPIMGAKTILHDAPFFYMQATRSGAFEGVGSNGSYDPLQLVSPILPGPEHY